MRSLCLLLTVLVVACGPGEQGPAGPTGPQGPKGEQGPGLNATVTYTCSGFFDMTGSGGGVYLSHNAWVFPDGSLMTTCAVGNNTADATAFYMFRAAQVGAVAANCHLTFDIDTPNSGWWKFEMNAGRTATKASYSDGSSPYNGRTTSVPCTKS